MFCFIKKHIYTEKNVVLWNVMLKVREFVDGRGVLVIGMFMGGRDPRNKDLLHGSVRGQVFGFVA